MQGFYAVALKASKLEFMDNVWETFVAEQDCGSYGLCDPRWHPNIVSRAKISLPKQDKVDYFVSSLPSLHPIVFNAKGSQLTGVN